MLADRRVLAAVFAGGAAGAIARAVVAEALPHDPGTWPWATFLVNVAGAFALGLVITREHVPDLYALPDTLAGPVLRAVAAAARATKKAFTADGVSVRQNTDPAGGQDVFHVHCHVVPRFAGDDFDIADYQRLSERTRSDQAEAMRRTWRG